jgi:hypothetical protein
MHWALVPVCHKGAFVTGMSIFKLKAGSNLYEIGHAIGHETHLCATYKHLFASSDAVPIGAVKGDPSTSL